MKRPRLVPRVFRPRPADRDQRIAKARPTGPVTETAPGRSGVPVINPRTGEPLTWAEHRENTRLAKSDTDGKHRGLQVGSVVHFEVGGQLLHGKILAWGAAGATVIERDGDTAEVPWKLLNLGLHPNATMQKSSAWHEEQPVRPTEWTRDDLAVGQFVSWSGFDGRAEAGQIVALGQHPEVEMLYPRSQRVRITYSMIKSAGWDRA